MGLIFFKHLILLFKLEVITFFLLLFSAAFATASPGGGVNCSEREMAQILSVKEPAGPAEALVASTKASVEGGSWLVKSRDGKVVFLRKTDFGEMGKAQTDYFFLRKNQYFAKVKTYAYAEPIYIAKNPVLKLIASEVFLVCHKQVWIPLQNDEGRNAEQVRRFRDIQLQLTAPELADRRFGVE